MKKILIITGSYPPQVCGVGDYTSKLISAQNARNWILYHSNNWSLCSLLYHIRCINKMHIKYINMQYPTQGYGWSLVPHMLAIYFSLFTQIKFSVTIHEQSQLTLKARIAQYFLILFSNKVIFTNAFERNFALKKYPFLKSRSTVIKIFSNIVVSDSIKCIEQRKYDIINFGHIRPKKGLETFLESIKNMQYKYRVCIAGQIPDGYEEYGAEIQRAAEKLEIETLINLSENEVSNLLNNSKLIYLPFPDGISERRGSFLASALNGTVVYTTIGKFTTSELKEAVIDSNDFSIEFVLGNMDLLKLKQQKGVHFMQTQMPHSWDDVVEQYNNFL